MGYAVLHLDKAQGGDSKMSSHIERKNHPENADETRTHLNRELINFPEGVNNRTQAIQHRIDNAGITRKVGKNQVRAIRILLSGSNEDMTRIEKQGKLNDWCNDNLNWVKQTFGADNLVSAVLHMDELTPHIHATVIPIVTGERRKAKQENEEQKGKKKYRKKDKNMVRLCADDVITRDKLKEYQNTYAEAMQSYGLQRGVDGSEAKHISTAQYYRELFEKKEVLQEHVDFLYQERIVVEEKVHDMYNQRDEVRDKFLVVDNHLEQKNQELKLIESKVEKAQQAYEPYKAQDELNQIHELMPMVKEQLRIADLCKDIGLSTGNTKQLLDNKTLNASSFNFFSPEHNRKFEAKDFKLKVEKEPDDPNKLRLALNGINILEWFKQMFKKIQKAIIPNIKPNINRGGMKR